MQGITTLQTVCHNDEGKYLSDKSSVLKLLGDLCTFVYHIGPSYFVPVLEYPEQIAGKQPGVTDLALEADQVMGQTSGLGLGVGIGASLPAYKPLLDYLVQGEQAYRDAMEHINRDDTSGPELKAQANYDLGFNLFQQVHHMLLSGHF